MIGGTEATALADANGVGDVAPARAALAQHSNASADWGTPELGRRLAAVTLKPAATRGEFIDLDYASSAYWQSYWPDRTRPLAFLDGSEGRSVLVEGDRHRAAGLSCGAGFLNAPGLNGGRTVQACWELLEHDHRTGWLGSGVWWGFSLEQLASLQGCGQRHPLSITEGITTLIPSRRCRYLLHPEQYIAILRAKQAKRERGSKLWLSEQREIDALLARTDDAPVTPPAPPHSSYITILWHRDRGVRRRQQEAVRQFLAAQAELDRSLFQHVAICGVIS